MVEPTKAMGFEFATATRIVFGRGVSAGLPAFVTGLGSRPLVVSGKSGAAAGPLVDLLRNAGIAASRLVVSNEPTIETVLEGVAVAATDACDVVVAVGGGSAIDAGKATAALLANGGHPLDYLEVIGKGRAITRPSVPMIAVPTTAGSGAEVTRNAVLVSADHRVKVSLRSPLILPRLALVDPVLTRTLPPALTAFTGLDALAQLVEPLLSRKANQLTDALCREGLPLVARSLPVAYRDGQNLGAREDMSLASLFGGLALANAGLGAVHGFAGPIGGLFPAPHGAVCAALLPSVMRVNLAALARGDDASGLARADEIAALLTGRAGARAEEGVEWIRALGRRLEVPGLRAYGVTRDAVPRLVADAKRSSSMRGNPVDLSDQELTEILTESL